MRQKQNPERKNEINNNEHTNHKRKPTKEGVDLADARHHARKTNKNVIRQ